MNRGSSFRDYALSVKILSFSGFFSCVLIWHYWYQSQTPGAPGFMMELWLNIFTLIWKCYESKRKLTTAVIVWEHRLWRIQAMFSYFLYFYDQNQLVKEGGYFVYRIRPQSIIKEVKVGTCCRNWKRGCWISFHGLLFCISYSGTLAKIHYSYDDWK